MNLNLTTKFDPIFQMEQSYFTNEVFFYQDVKIKDSLLMYRARISISSL